VKVFTYIILAVFFVLATTASANPSNPLLLDWNYSPVRQNPIEQYLPVNVTNTTASLGYGNYNGVTWGCSWDVDDNSTFSDTGDLNAGASTSVNACQVMGTYNSPNPSSCQYDFANARRCGFPVGVRVVSSSSSLNVSLCFSQGPCFNPQPKLISSRSYEYTACVRAIYPYQDSRDADIPGSGGGHGIINDEVLTVSNPTNKSVKGIFASLNQIGWYQGLSGSGPVNYQDPSAPYCYYDNIDAQTDGIFRWTLSG